ncbi:MAG TPA: hypothetical protein VIR63_02995 [Pontiella sp.]
MEELKIDQNRAVQKYSGQLQLLRIYWAIGKIVFRIIPRPFYAPRRMVLRLFGAKVGRNVNISNTAAIYFPWNFEIGDWSALGERTTIYSLGKICIGSQVTISQGAHLCAGSHDYRDPVMPLLTPPISIESQAWVCADAFIGPGVTIGEGAVVGARSVVFKNVNPWTVVAGNPAGCIKQRELN